MDLFTYRDGTLYCEDVALPEIAAAAGTPTYVYSAGTLLAHYRSLAQGFAELKPLICFSVKSCQNLHILRMLGQEGAGMDVVSGGELFRARQAGVDAGKIVYAGVGKTDKELIEAIEAGIGLFNIESEAELANLIELARRRGRKLRAALRVNPDVDPKSHRHTSTGKRETKFGVDLERARRVFNEFGRQEHVHLCGIHLHLGSPVNTWPPYVEAIEKILALVAELRRDGFTIDTFDLGGGFGAIYGDKAVAPIADYAAHIVPLLRGRGLQIVLEPGRSIAGNAAVLLTQVTFVKRGGDKQFLIVDGAMTELIRPALYEAYHFTWPVSPGVDQTPPSRSPELKLPGTAEVDVVGPVCESADFLAKGRWLPPVKRGDLLAVFTAGAYGFVMASHYNSRPNAAEVLVRGKTFQIIRRREGYPDLVAAELPL